MDTIRKNFMRTDSPVIWTLFKDKIATWQKEKLKDDIQDNNSDAQIKYDHNMDSVRDPPGESKDSLDFLNSCHSVVYGL